MILRASYLLEVNLSRMRAVSEVLSLVIPAELLRHAEIPLARAGGLQDIYSVADLTVISHSGFLGSLQQMDGPASSSSSAESFEGRPGARSSNRLQLVLEDIRCDLGGLWRRGMGALHIIRAALRNTAWTRLHETPTPSEDRVQEELDEAAMASFEAEYRASMLSSTATGPSSSSSIASSSSHSRGPDFVVPVVVLSYPHPTTIEPHEAGKLTMFSFFHDI